MMNIGWTELLVILIVALVIFGPGKLPDVGKALGKTIREFKGAVNKVDQEIKQEVNAFTEATGLDEVAKDLQSATKGVTDLNKELKDITKINPLKDVVKTEETPAAQIEETNGEAIESPQQPAAPAAAPEDTAKPVTLTKPEAPAAPAEASEIKPVRIEIP